MLKKCSYPWRRENDWHGHLWCRGVKWFELGTVRLLVGHLLAVQNHDSRRTCRDGSPLCTKPYDLLPGVSIASISEEGTVSSTRTKQCFWILTISCIERPERRRNRNVKWDSNQKDVHVVSATHKVQQVSISTGFTPVRPSIERRTSTWSLVYELMRYNVRSCPLKV